MRKYLICSILCIILTVNCTSKSTKEFLVEFSSNLSKLPFGPAQMTALIFIGVASLPFFAEADLKKANKSFGDSGTAITLADTYESAYGKNLKDVGEDGDTGDRFQRCKVATRYFQRILKQYGFRHYNNYIITSIDTAKAAGFVLFAVIQRPVKSIVVHYKYSGEIRKFEFSDRLFYEPYKRDVNGRPLDTIIDYVGVHSDYYTTQKMQAIMLTLAANSVVNGKVSPDYWEIEEQWISGDYLRVMRGKNQQILKALKL
jgi:hypothetical protein